MPSTYSYSIATDFSGVLDPDFLTTSIKTSAIASVLEAVSSQGDACSIQFATALSAGDEALLDGLVAAHGLAAAKAQRYVAIDSRTTELIELGYTFSGKQFSLTLAAQSTLLGLDASRADPALVYPVDFNTKDDGDAFSVPDAATVHNLFLTALGTYRAHKDSGTALKSQVRAAATIAAVNAVVDGR